MKENKKKESIVVIDTTPLPYGTIVSNKHEKTKECPARVERQYGQEFRYMITFNCGVSYESNEQFGCNALNEAANDHENDHISIKEKEFNDGIK